MRTIVLASSNKHKIKEFKDLFPNNNILSLNDINYFEEIEEDGETFFDNALIKAKTIHKYLKEINLEVAVIADDSGLCVDALDGEPGVYSARYAGNHGDNQENRAKLLSKLEGKNNRKASFICALIEYFPNGDCLYVQGTTEGSILENEIGDSSFGYDCLFYSNDLEKAFGEASLEEKNKVSHRARAIKKLIEEEKKYFATINKK